MTIHISIRLAWHDSGWNGCVCRDPKSNTHCVGQYSYQGDLIIADRDLNWEQPRAGEPCCQLDRVPPCIHSINAFGPDELEAYMPPPTWFRDETQVKKWPLRPYTVSTWPYEEMYKDEVLNSKGSSPKHNPIKRREAAKAFFDQVEPDHSLVFYYANYSNPFSENDQNLYVVVGASRVKAVEFRHNNSEGELTRSFYQFFYKSSLGHRGSPFPTAVDDANNGYDSRGVVV